MNEDLINPSSDIDDTDTEMLNDDDITADDNPSKDEKEGKGCRKKNPKKIFSPKKQVKLKRTKRFTCHICSRRCSSQFLLIQHWKKDICCKIKTKKYSVFCPRHRKSASDVKSMKHIKSCQSCTVFQYQCKCHDILFPTLRKVEYHLQKPDASVEETTTLTTNTTTTETTTTRRASMAIAAPTTPAQNLAASMQGGSTIQNQLLAETLLPSTTTVTTATSTPTTTSTAQNLTVQLLQLLQPSTSPIELAELRRQNELLRLVLQRQL
jgi:hypothetical protein